MKKTLLLLAGAVLLALSITTPSFADDWPDPGPQVSAATMAR